MFESRYASTLSSDEMNESHREPISESNKKDNTSFYNQINKIKKRWENFSNNSRISNLNETVDLNNRSAISRNIDMKFPDNNNNSLNVSQMALNDLKSKLNQVSSRTSNITNRQNMNSSILNEVSTHSTNQNSNSNIEIKRKSIKK